MIQIELFKENIDCFKRLLYLNFDWIATRVKQQSSDILNQKLNPIGLVYVLSIKEITYMLFSIIGHNDF